MYRFIFPAFIYFFGRYKKLLRWIEKYVANPVFSTVRAGFGTSRIYYIILWRTEMKVLTVADAFGASFNATAITAGRFVFSVPEFSRVAFSHSERGVQN